MSPVPNTVAARPHVYRPQLTLHTPNDAERERDLIERARGGDRDAFGALVRTHLPGAIRLAMRITRNEADAEDIVQDAFLSALRNIDDFELGRPFWPWLARIVANRSLDVVGSKGRQGETLAETIPSDSPNPSQSAERGELMDRVRAVIATMPPRQRLVVEMYELEGASVAEIAQQTGSAAATVRWHLHVGRRTLRAALAHLYGEDR